MNKIKELTDFYMWMQENESTIADKRYDYWQQVKRKIENL